MNWTDIRQEEKNSIPVALCIVSGYFGYFMQYMNITGQWALSNFAFGIIIAFLSFAARVKGHKYSTKAKRTHLIFTVIITIVYMWSVLFKSSNYLILYYLFYVILPAYVISGGFRVNIVLRTLCVVSIPTVLFYNSIFALSYIGLNQASMGITYFVLDLASAFILYIIYYRKEHRWYMTIAYVSSVILLIGIILHGVRGAILSLVILLVISYINKQSYNDEVHLLNDKRRTIRIGIIGLLSIVLLTNYAVIFEAIYELAYAVLPSVPGFITKMVIYIRTGNILNGRDSIISGTFDVILKHPILGVGVGNFGKFFVSTAGNNIVYPHNYLLQFWAECGIIPAVIALMTTITAFKKLLFIRKEEKDNVVALIFFTSLIFPRFFVSLNIWSFTEIWMGLYCVINLVTNREQESETINE